MAERKPAEQGKNMLVTNIVIKPVNRTKLDVGKWRTALQSAEALVPNRTPLLNLYHDILLDDILGEGIERRTGAILGTPIVYMDNGKPVDAINDLIDEPFFETMVKELLNSKFWGHTLLEFTFGEDISVDLIERKNVDPKLGLVLKNETDRGVGIPYREPYYERTVLEAGDHKDLGLLLRCAPYVIMKRGDFGDWAQFVEVFGMPWRVGKYDSYDEDTRKKLEQAFELAGSATWMVIPKDGTVDLLQNNNSSDGAIFEKLKDACDAANSIIILGQTMTTKDTSGSGYAQGKIHQAVELGKYKSDRRFILRLLNKKFRRLLELNGYPVGNGKFIFQDDDGMSKLERLQFDMMGANQVPIPDDYFYETYGWPKPSPTEPRKDEPEPDDEPVEDDEPDDDDTTPKPAKDKKLKEKAWLKLYNAFVDFFGKAPEHGA